MDTRSHIMRFRKSHKKNRSNPMGVIGLLVAILISITATGGAIFAVYRFSESADGLPPPDQMERLLEPPGGSLLFPTRIYDRTGEIVLWEFENSQVDFRWYVNITDGSTLFFHEVSEEIINAVIAAQDPSYLLRSESFLRGILNNHSDPIPRLLVEEFLLWNEPDHANRGFRINLLVNQLVSQYGREKILEWYLNSAYFGNQIYGIEQATKVYFGKSAADLDLAESALIAGIASYPSLNPYNSPEGAKENQEIILAKMLDLGMITRAEKDRAVQKQLFYPDPEITAVMKAPAFVEYILQEAEKYIPRDYLIRGGYKITSTIDASVQLELECSTNLLVARAKGLDPELDPSCESSRLLPRYVGPELTETDSLEINLVVLDPLNGELVGMLAMNENGDSLDLGEDRNPGTVLTPFLYLNHFTKGFEPASLVWDIPREDLKLNEAETHPFCEMNCEFLGPVNIRTALMNDYISPAWELWQDQGINQLEKTLSSFGVSPGPQQCSNCEVFSGIPAIDIIDLAQAFGVLANRGYLKGRPTSEEILKIQPASIQFVDDLSGWQTLIEQEFIENKIISEELAFLVNDVLSDQESRENGDIYQIGRIAGVKPGIVPETGNAWVIGYTPQIVTAVWAGNPGNGIESEIDYLQLSSELWRGITQYLSQEQDIVDWEMPSGIISVDVCYPSGMLPSEYCPREVREIFIVGSEPLSRDTLFQALEINRETGLLASVFTPPRLIEETIYLDYPPEALPWAEEEGISTPPQLYDLDTNSLGDPDFYLSTPDNLDFVRGRVRIIGSIPQEDFLSARLQFGKGMNPSSWLQIGEEISTPGNNRWLGYWDTTDLPDGVYAIQLVLIKDDQQINKSSLVVSVDNTPPEIILRSDLAVDTFNYLSGKEIIFEVVFENSSEIEQVDFYLDGELLTTRYTEPFITPWVMRLGTHELLIQASDQAGNESELSFDFKVIRE